MNKFTSLNVGPASQARWAELAETAVSKKVIQLGNVKLNPSVKFLGVSRKVFTRGPGMKLIQSKTKGLQYGGNGRVEWDSSRVIRSSMYKYYDRVRFHDIVQSVRDSA